MSIERMPAPLLGGINVHDDPAALPDGQWQRLQNLAPRKTGIVGQRQSMSFVREVEPTSPWNASQYNGAATRQYYKWAENLRPIRFMFSPLGELAVVAMTTAATGIIERDSGAYITTPVTNTVPAGTMLLFHFPNIWTTADELVCRNLGVATVTPSLFMFNGTIYAFAGQNNGGRVSEAGTSLGWDYYSVDFGSGNPNFNPDGACVVRDRVVYYKGSNLYWSDRNDPLTISTSGVAAEGTRDIYLGGEELEPITAVAELSTSADGSPVQSVAAAWTKSRCYMLLGEPLETDDSGDVIGSLQINRLNIEAGCVSQASVVRTPYGTLWAGMDDVWFMPYGSLPIRVGTSIREYLEGQPAGLAWRIHAEYYDGFYRLSLFDPGQGPQMYDACGMQLWLDLRSGPPQSAADAKWFGPQVFVQSDAPTSGGALGGPPGVWCMARDTRASGDGRLYALQSYVMPAGIPDALIEGLSLCGFDTHDGRDTCAPQASVTLWEANTAVYEGTIMVPTPGTGVQPGADAGAPIFICTTAGTTGGSAPDWLTVNASGIRSDNTVNWTVRYFDGTNPLNGYDLNLLQSDNEVEWSMLSKEFMLGDPMAEKLLDGAELGYWSQNATQLTYNSHPKQDERSRVLTPDYEQTAENVANQTTGDRVWQRKLLTADPTKRFHGLSAIWECEQDAGIVIVSGVNDTLVTNWGTVTITAGYYADVAALADEVCTQFAADIQVAGLTSTIADDGGYIRALVGFKVVAFGGEVLEITVDDDAHLARLLGFTTTTSAIEPAYTFGQESPRAKFSPDTQISGINLRYKLFGRRPT